MNFWWFSTMYVYSILYAYQFLENVPPCMIIPSCTYTQYSRVKNYLKHGARSSLIITKPFMTKYRTVTLFKNKGNFIHTNDGQKPPLISITNSILDLRFHF